MKPTTPDQWRQKPDIGAHAQHQEATVTSPAMTIYECNMYIHSIENLQYHLIDKIYFGNPSINNDSCYLGGQVVAVPSAYFQGEK